MIIISITNPTKKNELEKLFDYEFMKRLLCREHFQMRSQKSNRHRVTFWSLPVKWNQFDE